MPAWSGSRWWAWSCRSSAPTIICGSSRSCTSTSRRRPFDRVALAGGRGRGRASAPSCCCSSWCRSGRAGARPRAAAAAGPGAVSGAEFGHGFRLLELATVGSTNDVRAALADAGEPAGLIVRAERQTAGRGRHGRSWQSPPGNLYASLLLRPARPLAEVASLSLVVALALAEAIERAVRGPAGASPEMAQRRAGRRRQARRHPARDGVADARRGHALADRGHRRQRRLGTRRRSALSRDLPGRALGSSVAPRGVLAALAAPLRPRLDRLGARRASRRCARIGSPAPPAAARPVERCASATASCTASWSTSSLAVRSRLEQADGCRGDLHGRRGVLGSSGGRRAGPCRPVGR